MPPTHFISEVSNFFRTKHIPCVALLLVISGFSLSSYILDGNALFSLSTSNPTSLSLAVVGSTANSSLCSPSLTSPTGSVVLPVDSHLLYNCSSAGLVLELVLTLTGNPFWSALGESSRVTLREGLNLVQLVTEYEADREIHSRLTLVKAMLSNNVIPAPYGHSSLVQFLTPIVIVKTTQIAPIAQTIIGVYILLLVTIGLLLTIYFSAMWLDPEALEDQPGDPVQPDAHPILVQPILVQPIDSELEEVNREEAEEDISSDDA